MELWPTELLKSVRNVAVAAHWIVGPAGEERFWFREQLVEGGDRVVVVDAASGAQVDDVDPAVGEPPSPADAASPPGPNGRALFTRRYELWLRDADGRERVITEGGAAHSAWGGWPDMDLRAIERSRQGAARPPFGCFWSPRGDRVLVVRVDERELLAYPYLESVPADGSHRPRVHWVRQQLAGESQHARHDWQLIGPDDAARVAVSLPPDEPRWQIDAATSGSVFWRRDGRHVIVMVTTPNDDHVGLVEIDAATGSSRLLHEERSATWFDANTFQYSRANLRLLPSGDELVWYSQQDGWGHLYIVDLARGGIARRLTEWPWAVQDIIHVADGAVFFTACGRAPGRHPYYRHLYRVPLDAQAANAGLVMLTPEDADHAMGPGPSPIIAAALRVGPAPSAVSPRGRHVVDTHSTVRRAPVTVLRDARDGRLIAEVTRADVSSLEATDWQPPEIFSAKAADGTTDLYGVLLKPRDFDAKRSYPVVERIYGGPQIVAQPRNFFEALGNGFVYGAWSLAELGIVVVIVDGPGTPCRSKAFHDMTYGQPDRWGLAHHRAAIEGAAKTRPWMDLSRVGVSGHSYGGYGTAMAMLLEPDFYRVGVSSAGMYDPMWAQQSTPERHLGSPRFAGGSPVKTRPDEVAENFLAWSPSRYAERLRGRLLLAYGDLDENIQPAALLALSKALIDAGKHFDELCMPGRNHGFAAEVYFQKRMWDYFVEHLQGREPLRHLKIDAAPGQRVLL